MNIGSKEDKLLNSSSQAANYFFNQAPGNSKKLAELGDMKELRLKSSTGKTKGKSLLNISGVPDVEILPEISLPAIPGFNQ